MKGERKPRWGMGENPERIRNATRSSICVFSVDTPEQAVAAITRFCVHRYDDSCAWTDWPRDALQLNDGGYEEVCRVTDRLRAWWEGRDP